MTVELVLRWTHIFAAIILVGGTFFLRFVLVPAGDAGGQTGSSQLAVWRPRWARWVMIASGLLLISGLINAVRIIKAYEFLPDAHYHVWVAIKLLLAMIVFWISAALAGRSSMAERLRARYSLWLNVNVILAVAVVGLGGYMKVTPRMPKPAGETTRIEAHRLESRSAQPVPSARGDAS